MVPVVSAMSCEHAAASSRRSLPRASTRARTPSASARRRAALNSPTTNDAFSASLVTGSQTMTGAPEPVIVSSIFLPRCPPPWTTTTVVSGSGAPT